MAEVVFDNVPDEILHAVIECWHFKEGDHVEKGEDLVDLKGDNNVTITLKAPVTGIVTNRFYREDEEVEIGEVLAEIKEETEILEEDLEIDEYEEESELEADEEQEEIETEDETQDTDEEDEY